MVPNRRRLRRTHSDLTNTPVQAETQLHTLERAAAGIGLYVNAHKTECMCFNKTSTFPH